MWWHGAPHYRSMASLSAAALAAALCAAVSAAMAAGDRPEPMPRPDEVGWRKVPQHIGEVSAYRPPDQIVLRPVYVLTPDEELPANGLYDRILRRTIFGPPTRRP
jgi:hypothetical protein